MKNDCFISYCHVDNVGTDVTAGSGWVSQFRLALKARVGEYLGRSANIWMDPHLNGNDEFPDELRDRVSASAVLVTIVSPGYRTSEWCTREFTVFREHAEREGRWRIGNQLAVMKVVRTPLDSDEHQVFPVDSLGYWFYATDKQTDRPQRFETDSAAYKKRLEELAQDIASFLKSIEKVALAATVRADVISPDKEILLACDAVGLDRKERVMAVSCVTVDRQDELSRRMMQFKNDIVLDPAFSSNEEMLSRIRRTGLHYQVDGDILRDRVADELSILPWDGYVSFMDFSEAAAKTEAELVLQLLHGVLFDRLRAYITSSVMLVLSRQLVMHWQSISDAATWQRQEIKAMDGVKMVGTSAVRVEERTNAALEVANYLASVTVARLSSEGASEARRFARVYPNKLRVLHDMSRNVLYSRKQPFPLTWRLP